MRKQTLRLALVPILTLFLSGCAILYTDIKTPLPSLSTTADAQGTTLVGKASCASYVWVVALGDCSVQAAMKNGGISKVHHVDSEINSYFLGIYTKFTTVVYGE
jgi:hypothetical protein